MDSMRHLVVMLVIILGGVLMPMNAVGQVKASPASAKTDKKGEPFAGGILIDAIGSSFRDPVKLERLIEEVKKTPFTHIFLQVRAYGDAYYISEVAPKAYGVTDRLTEAEAFDPLAIFLQAMKKDATPRMVYAWIVPFRVSNVNRAVPESAAHVVKAHPDWLSRNSAMKTEDADGNRYLEPGLEAVQEHLERVVAEIALKYPVDGIAIDGLSYPGSNADWGYHTQVLDKWKAAGGSNSPDPNDVAWGQMRREIIDTNLSRMSRAARAARAGIQILVMAKATGQAPFTAEEFVMTTPYKGSLQNWVGWMKKENKDVDRVILENFRSEADASAEFDGWNAFAANVVKETKVEVLTGVSGTDNISLDAMAQMRRTLESGLLGVVLSNFQKPIQDNASRELFFRALSGTVLAADSTRHAFPEGETIAASAPTLSEVAAAGSTKPAANSGFGDNTEIPPPPAPLPVEPPPAPRTTEDLMKEFPTDTLGTYSNLVKPSDEALDFLKRMYSNIF